MSPWSAATPDTSAESSGGGRRGVGLRNTAKRLAELYSSDYRFTVGPDSADAGGTLAEVQLPYHVRIAADQVRSGQEAAVATSLGDDTVSDGVTRGG